MSAEQAERRLEEIRHYPEKVVVRVRTRWLGRMCLPDPDGDGEETAVFKTLTYGDNQLVERICRHQVEDDESRFPMYEVDVGEVKRMVVRRNLLEWTLDIPIEREDGWMTARCYRRVSSIPAPLLEAFLDEFERQTMVSVDEEEEISRQCSVLFNKNSSGVADACEAVGMFCTWGNFSEKFGLDKDALARLPYREYLLLKLMVSQESSAMKRESVASKPSATRVVGRGGRTRTSSAIRTPM